MDIINNIYLNSVIVVILSISSIYLGFLAYRQNKDLPTNRLFSQFAIFTGLWILLAFIPDIPFLRNFALISAKANYLALLIVSFTLIEFPFHFPRQRVFNKYIKFTLLFVMIVIASLTLFTNKIIGGLAFYDWGTSYVDGDFAFLFYIYMMIGPINSIIQSLYMWRKLNNQEKKKVKYFVIGLSIFMMTNIILQSIVKPLIVHTDEFYKIGNYSAIFMIVLTSYSIVKYNLFDIKVITTEIITAIIWIVLFSKLLVSRSLSEAILDGFILSLIIVFGILLIRSVINEVKQRRKLEELTQKLKDLDKQKDEFINVAAHELRAPITAIKGYLSMIVEGDAGAITDKTRGYLIDAIAVNERLIRLVNNMLNVSRIEEGRIVYQIEEINLSRIAKTVYDSFKFEAERKNIKFSLNITPAIKDKVKVDADRVNEIIGNFVSNAVKFTEKGTIDINIKQVGKDYVRLEVSDTGPGISKEEQKKLFKKFYRAESTAGKTIGTGLGLYISKLLVEAFKGKIGLESEFGKGSTFWFEIPLAESLEEISKIKS